MSPKQKDVTDKSGFDEWNTFDRVFFSFFFFPLEMNKCTKMSEEFGISKYCHK